MSLPEKAAVIGAGVIGAGWVARYLWNGVDVAVYDPHPQAERRCREVLATADASLERLLGGRPAATGRLTFAPSLAEAVRGAGAVQESAPEREDVKRAVLAEVDAHAPPDALVGSSTSGLLPSRLQADMARPGRCFVSHPFNPVYLLPLVELCGGAGTDPEAIEAGKALYTALGMRPLHVRKEIDGFVADRLLEALWREALWLVHDDVASVEEVDDAVRFGAGLRWALMGTFQTYRIAGGEAGMRHFMAQFGPALQWPWTKLMDVPELTEDLVDKIAAQSDQQAAGRSLRQLERERDDGLIALLRALQGERLGAGAVLADYQRARFARLPVDLEPARAGAVRTAAATVAGEHLDPAGVMAESACAALFERATAALVEAACTAAAAAGGPVPAPFAAESRLTRHAPVRAGTAVEVASAVVEAEASGLHLVHRLVDAADGTELASAEQTVRLLDPDAGGAGALPGPALAALQRLAGTG